MRCRPPTARGHGAICISAQGALLSNPSLSLNLTLATSRHVHETFRVNGVRRMEHVADLPAKSAWVRDAHRPEQIADDTRALDPQEYGALPANLSRWPLNKVDDANLLPWHSAPSAARLALFALQIDASVAGSASTNFPCGRTVQTTCRSVSKRCAH